MTVQNSNNQMVLNIIGDTAVCKWKDNKVAALSIGADDSIHSQLDFMILEMDKRSFKGTFWINPGRGTPGEWGFCWESRKDEWMAAARRGHDFGNHTVYHVGARFYEEAEYEIGESARIIWASNPGQRLQLFMGGGSTTWNVSKDEVDEILAKYDCVRGRGGSKDNYAFIEETGKSATSEELISYVDAAIAEGSWHSIICHGVGLCGEWIVTDAGPFTALLDYLVENKDKVWVETCTKVHKYDSERASASVAMLEAGDSRVRLNLACDKNPVLYDYPLTLRTKVPDFWNTCRVTQGRTSKTYPVTSGVVQYGVLPGIVEINLVQGI